MLFSTLDSVSRITRGGEMEFYYQISNDKPLQLNFNEVHEIFEQHSWLDSSEYYTFTNKHDIRLHFTDHAIEHINFMCPQGRYKAEGYFFDRNSDRAVVCIPPWGAEIRDIVRLAGIFKEFDIILLEYKDSATNKPLKLSPFFLKQDTIKNLGNTIDQAFNWLTHKKHYREIIGHGQCYGAWILLESQSNPHNKAFFNKIILDSCPLSLYSIFENSYNNPRGIWSLGKKKSSYYIKKILHYAPFLKTFYTGILRLFFKDISAASLVSTIQVPILFIQGNEDYLVTPDQFKILYENVAHKDKSAFITPFKHLLHSLKSKELYRHHILDFINKK